MVKSSMMLFIAAFFLISFAVLVLIHYSVQFKIAPMLQPLLTVLLGLLSGFMVITLFSLDFSFFAGILLLIGIGISFFSFWFAKAVIKSPPV
ncbi:hypothetical protein [Jeotgalibacillus proteolyticus]|uniref:hypothetical protein n=1 Tax=Jeotgalibacillus proteolyticus TaxID=2082395 RepID=UPI003CEEFF39